MRKFRLFLHSRLFLCILFALALIALGICLCIWLPAALAPIAAAERLFSLGTALYLTAKLKEDAAPKLLLILLLPWMGAVFCLLFRPLSPSAKEAERGTFPCTVKEAEYFPTGREMGERLLADLSAARKSIWLEYYIIAEGVFWGDILSVLEERAGHGVDIRLICDGFGSLLTLPGSYKKELARRNIRQYLFRPLRPGRGMGRRDHRKIAVIDGTIAYTGGINLADEYVGEKIRFGHWKDTAVRLTGSCTGVFSQLFAKSWNEGNPTDMVRPFSVKGGTIPALVISDEAHPTQNRAGKDCLMRLAGQTKKRLYLNTPYLAPDPALRDALKAAAAHADVRLMIPHIPDKKLPFLLTRAYAAELERSGVKVREYTDGFLHAKSAVSDEECWIGSYNLDRRSLFLQAECGIAIRQKTLSDEMSADFLHDWEMGTPLSPLTLPQRIAAFFLDLFASLL